MKKLKLLLAAVGFFLFLWTGFHLCMNWWGNREWQRVRAELGAKGELLEFAELQPRPVRDDENIALAPFFLSLRGTDGKKIAAQLEETVSAVELPGDPSEEDVLTVACKFNPEFQGTVNDAWKIIFLRLNQVAPLLDQVSQDLKRPVGVWPLESDNATEALHFVYDSPTASVASSLLELYFVRGLGAVATGDANAAIDSVVVLLQMNGLLQALGPLQAWGLGALAVYRAERIIFKALTRGLWTSEEMRVIVGQLGKVDLVSAAARAWRIERCAFAAETNEDLLARMLFGFGKFRMARSQPYRPTSEIMANMSFFQSASKILRPEGLRDLERAKFFEMTQGWIESLEARLPTESEGQSKYPSYFHLRFFIQPLEHERWAYLCGANNAFAFAFQEELECTRLAVAISEYRLDHGRLPEKLEDLVPTYIGEILALPLTGGAPSFSSKENGSFQVGNVGIGGPPNSSDQSGN
jgi:hypothetical protein